MRYHFNSFQHKLLTQSRKFLSLKKIWVKILRDDATLRENIHYICVDNSIMTFKLWKLYFWFLYSMFREYGSPPKVYCFIHDSNNRFPIIATILSRKDLIYSKIISHKWNKVANLLGHFVFNISIFFNVVQLSNSLHWIFHFWVINLLDNFSNFLVWFCDLFTFKLRNLIPPYYIVNH